MGLSFFQMPFPNEVQHLVLSQFSNEELFQICLYTCKELSLRAGLLLLSRPSDDSNRLQQRFLKAWNRNALYFHWIYEDRDCIEAFESVLRKLAQNPVKNFATRRLALKTLLSLRSLPKSKEPLTEQKLFEYDYERVHNILLDFKLASRLNSAFDAILNLAPRLQPEQRNTLIRLIVPIYLRDDGMVTGWWRAYRALIETLPPDEKRLQLEEALLHTSEAIRKKVYNHLAETAKKMSCNEAEHFFKLICNNRSVLGTAIVMDCLDTLFQRMLLIDATEQEVPFLWKEHDTLFTSILYESFSSNSTHLNSIQISRCFALIQKDVYQPDSMCTGAAWNALASLYPRLSDSDQKDLMVVILRLIQEPKSTEPALSQRALRFLSQIACYSSSEEAEKRLEVVLQYLECTAGPSDSQGDTLGMHCCLALLHRMMAHRQALFAKRLFDRFCAQTMLQYPDILYAICAVAKDIPKADAGGIALGLVDMLGASTAKPHICQIIKACVNKLPQNDREHIRSVLQKMLDSDKQSLRKAALDIASFPGIIELWQAGNMPTSDCLESLYLKNMLEMQDILHELEPCSGSTPSL